MKQAIITSLGLILLATWNLGTLPLAGCGTCGSKDYVARLLEMQGDVRRDFSDAPRSWVQAQEGDRFRQGDGLRTGQSALLQLMPEGRMLVQEETIIRFRATLPEQGVRRIEVTAGQAEIETAGLELQIETAGGSTRIAPNSGVRVTSSGETSRLVVRTGRAVIEAAGASHQVNAGEGLLFDLGQASIERFPADGETDPSVAEQSAPQGLALEVQGAGVAVRQGDQWVPLAPGAATQPAGSEIRLGANSQLVLRRGAEQAEVSGPAAITVAAPDQALLTARAGRLVARAGEGSSTIAIPGGLVSLEAQSRVRLGVANGETRVTAEAGSLTVRTEQGTVQLTSGESTVVGRTGQVSTEPPEGRADLTVPAGESSVIHDPRPPTRLAIRFQCPAEGEVTVYRGRRSQPVSSARDEGRVVVELPPGVHRYRVNCLSQGVPAARATGEGRVRVLRDRGTKILPASPRITVEADGRRYLVHYQNRLPLVTFRWPEAPTAKQYHLVLQRKGTTRKIRLSRPRHRQRLGPGTAEFYFQREGQRSRTSTVTLTQSSQSQPAYLLRPREGRAAPGQEVEVRGGTFAQSKVTVNGRGPLELDRQGRFSTRVTVSGAHRALAVRVQNPLTGVHYFLRHLRGARR